MSEEIQDPTPIRYQLDLSLLAQEIAVSMIEEYFGGGGCVKEGTVFILTGKEYKSLKEGVTLEAIQDQAEWTELDLKSITEGIKEINDLCEEIDDEDEIEFDFSKLVEAL